MDALIIPAFILSLASLIALLILAVYMISIAKDLYFWTDKYDKLVNEYIEKSEKRFYALENPAKFKLGEVVYVMKRSGFDMDISYIQECAVMGSKIELRHELIRIYQLIHNHDKLKFHHKVILEAEHFIFDEEQAKKVAKEHKIKIIKLNN